MQHRIELLIKEERLTSGKLAEMIGVQPSAISHIISGRNKPGFDFIAKLLKGFPRLNPKWLILGDDPMYITPGNTAPVNLFEIDETPSTKTVSEPVVSIDAATEQNLGIINNLSDSSQIERIVIFYKNGKFQEYSNK